jgi:hypothetical protein
LFERLDLGQSLFVDFLEAAEVSGERANVVVDALATEIFEQVVVGMNAVERRVCWMRFVKVPEEIVHEMRKRFRNGHGSYECADVRPVDPACPP